jgi:hypothetical protein
MTAIIFQFDLKTLYTGFLTISRICFYWERNFTDNSGIPEEFTVINNITVFYHAHLFIKKQSDFLS